MGQALPISAHQLEEAFETFNRMSHQLGTSYRELEKRVTDLTEELTQTRSARLEELAEKERLANRLSDLLDTLPGGVIVLDDRDCILETNPEACEFLGQPLIGINWLEVLRREAIQPLDQTQEICLSGYRRISLSDRVQDANGNQVILLTDITEAHELREWTNRDKRLSALGEMASRLAHQIRTPLSSALLYVSNISNTHSDQAAQTRIAMKVTDRLKHMERLVDSMLSFIRGGRTEFAAVSLLHILEELKHSIAPQIDARGGKLIFDLPEIDLIFQGNREALLSSLVNIAENAINIEQHPHIEVTVLEHDLWLEIHIKDHGPGIDENVLERIFDPFFTTRSQGNGLGLAVAAMTARAHGGDIKARNYPEGGAEFCFRLPKIRTIKPALASGMWASSPTPARNSSSTKQIPPKSTAETPCPTQSHQTKTGIFNE